MRPYAYRRAAVLMAILQAAPLLVSAGAPAPAAGATAPLPSVSLPPDLQRVLTDYESAWQHKDAAALAALFVEDGLVLPDDADPARGREAIRAHYAGAGGPLALRAYAYDTQGTSGYIVGAFARKRGGVDEGKFTLILRRDADGRWLIICDMDNGIRPRS
jgi:ketosteroid isomerase-like protein